MAVDCESKSGGLALWWNNDLVVDVLHYPKNHFHGLLTTTSDSGVKCILTKVYRPPETSRRSATWKFLKTLKLKEAIQWVVFGNFNVILTPNEKWSGMDKLKCQMEAFRDVLLVCVGYEI